MQIDVQPGDVLTIETPGGGGWGQPEEVTLGYCVDLTCQPCGFAADPSETGQFALVVGGEPALRARHLPAAKDVIAAEVEAGIDLLSRRQTCFQWLTMDVQVHELSAEIGKGCKRVAILWKRKPRKSAAQFVGELRNGYVGE